MKKINHKKEIDNVLSGCKDGVILCNDAYEVLCDIPDNSIHMIITSPPYNVGIEYLDSNDRQDQNKYLDYMRKVLSECYRVLISGGRIAINLPSSILESSYSRNAYLSLDFVLIMRELGFLDREWIGWIKMKNGGMPGKSTAWGSWLSPSMPYCRDAMEYIIVMDKESHKRYDRKGHNDITKKEFLRYTSNCWCMTPEINRKFHPAPFPKELPYRLIKLYTWEGDIVLDPFIGWGTTAVVAAANNRRYIGIDISNQYCNVTQQRIWELSFPLFD